MTCPMNQPWGWLDSLPGERMILNISGVPARAEIIPVEPDPGHAGEGISEGKRLVALFLFMNITLNGNQHLHQGSGTLVELLKELGTRPEQVAILVNDRIVPKGEREAFRLHEGDRVEILTFMGGG
jgi:thiamine biosynthesis protein ThiS